MPDDTYERLRALADAATPGPWLVAVEIDGVRAGRSTVVKASGQGNQSKRIVTVDQTRPHVDFDPVTRQHGHAERNVAFIAAARDAVPALLSVIEAIRQLHQPLLDSRSALHPEPLCTAGDGDWPCATVKALEPSDPAHPFGEDDPDAIVEYVEAAREYEGTPSGNPEVGARCGECRLGLGVHDPSDPYCDHHVPGP